MPDFRRVLLFHSVLTFQESYEAFLNRSPDEGDQDSCHCLCAVITIRLIGGHARQLKSSHQAVHSFDTDVHDIIALKNNCDFVSIKTLIVISINLKNKFGYFLIFLGAISRL